MTAEEFFYISFSRLNTTPLTTNYCHLEDDIGGLYRICTGVRGFADHCLATRPRGHMRDNDADYGQKALKQYTKKFEAKQLGHFRNQYPHFNLANNCSF